MSTPEIVSDAVNYAPIRYVYYREDLGAEFHESIRALSIGYRYNHNTNEIEYTVACCAKPDIFSRKKSHELINDRFEKNTYRVIPDSFTHFVTEPKYLEVITCIACDFSVTGWSLAFPFLNVLSLASFKMVLFD